MKYLLFLGLVLSLLNCANPQSEYETHLVTSEDITVKIEASGTLESKDSEIIMPPRIQNSWRYTISSMFPEGKKVSPGIPLVRFDDKSFRQKLAQAQASLASKTKEVEILKLEEREKLEQLKIDLAEAEAEEAKALRKLQIPEELQSHNETQTQRLDAKLAQEKVTLVKTKMTIGQENAETKIRDLENLVKSYQKKVDYYQDAIAKMTIKAKSSGLVVYRPKWNGEKHSVGERVFVGTAFMEIPNLSQMQVNAVIVEPDAGKVKLGQEVEIRLDANPSILFLGKIEEIGKIFRRKSSKNPSIVFDATVSIDAPDPDLMRPGMAAKLKIKSDAIPNLITIPQKAVQRDETGSFVYISSGLRGVTKQAIVTGRRFEDHVEVKDGLSSGQEILIPIKKKGDQS